MQQLRGRWKLIAGTLLPAGLDFDATIRSQCFACQQELAIAVYRLEGEHVSLASSPDT